MHDWRVAWRPGVMLSIVLSLRAAGASISPTVSARPARRDRERTGVVREWWGIGRWETDAWTGKVWHTD